jgi:PadR family transcriptional regulator, regulatory protein PadR
MEEPMKNEFFAGFIRLHILYHACEGPIFGLGILRELRRHGYELSPGTLYPLLHRMEERGLLKSEKELVTGKIRRLYSITQLGRETLQEAREKVRELFGELFSQESLFSPDRRQTEKDSDEP